MQIYPIKSLASLKTRGRKKAKEARRKGILKIALLDLNGPVAQITFYEVRIAFLSGFGKVQ